MLVQEMLESFHDETLGGLNTTRKVLVRGEEQLSETMQNYALRVRARLVVLVRITQRAAVAGSRVTDGGVPDRARQAFAAVSSWRP